VFRLFIKILSSFVVLFLMVPAAYPAEAQTASTQSTQQKAKSKGKHRAKQQPVKKQQAVKKQKTASKTAATNNIKSKRRAKAPAKTKVAYHQRRGSYRVTPAIYTAGDRAGLAHTRDPLDLKSNVALVIDHDSSKVLFEKNAAVALPIASITKLMTGLIVVEARLDMDEILEITNEDIDHEKNTSSRLQIGTRLSRGTLLHLALMSSENRAASALGRHYPGGKPAFVEAMNAKARLLGMYDTHYVDSNGLSSRNVASASDLAKLVVVAARHPILRQYSTDTGMEIDTGRRHLQFNNTNRLVRNPEWDIILQKTGYISEAGQCLVMNAKIHGRNIVMIFLDSKGKLSRLADAMRVRKWLTGSSPQV